MLKPRLCDERIKSPILDCPIGLRSVPLRSGNVLRTRVSPNCVSAGLGIHPVLFPLREEFSPLVRAFLGNFPGFFPLCFPPSSGNFPGIFPFFPGVTPRAKVSWLRLLVPIRRGSGVLVHPFPFQGQGIPFSITISGPSPSPLHPPPSPGSTAAGRRAHSPPTPLRCLSCGL